MNGSIGSQWQIAAEQFQGIKFERINFSASVSAQIPRNFSPG
jgi:hypothetical protein